LAARTGLVEGLADETLGALLRESVAALEAAAVPYALIGGLASSLYGRPRGTADADLFLKAADAKRALEALGEAGFETEEKNPKWIYKASKRGLTVDLMFALQGGITFDEEMLARARSEELAGVRVRVLAPEDLVVIKAIAHDEQSSRHWQDALAILASCELDWDYLLRRARHGARRLLSLLVYAQSVDLVVPEEAIRALYEQLYGAA
jgi:predicted nucleotidyltransferase